VVAGLDAVVVASCWQATTALPAGLAITVQYATAGIVTGKPAISLPSAARRWSVSLQSSGDDTGPARPRTYRLPAGPGATSAIDASFVGGCHGHPRSIDPSGSSMATLKDWLAGSIWVTATRPSPRNWTSCTAVDVRYGQPAAEVEGIGEGLGRGDGSELGVVEAGAVGDELDGVIDAAVEAGVGVTGADVSLDPGGGAMLGAGLHPTTAIARTATAAA
jgi:hypothetical protein